jgi:hypothetical protein
MKKTLVILNILLFGLLIVLAGDYDPRLSSGEVWITDYGAIPDDDQDDSISIQESLDSGRSVVIPDGVFNISTTIELNEPNIVLRGTGKNSIIRTDGDFDALELNASFLTLRDFFIQCGQPDATGDYAGIKVTNCTRSLIDNVRIGQSGYGFPYGIRMHGATKNWIISIRDPMLNYNTVGIWGMGHSTVVDGGEIQGGRHGIVQCTLNATNDPDMTDETTGNMGSGCRISGVAIEGQSVWGGIAYGIFIKHSHDFPEIEGCYFEAIGSGWPLVNGVGVQVGYNTKYGYTCFGGEISACNFNNVPCAIRIGRADGLTIHGNTALAMPNGAYFLDAKDASKAGSYISLFNNYTSLGNDYVINDPHNTILNSYVSAYPGDRYGTSIFEQEITFANGLQSGKHGIERGTAVLWHGTGGNKPGYVKIHSPNGTGWYLFVEDDGTIKVYNDVPRQNADGNPIGDQTD